MPAEATSYSWSPSISLSDSVSQTVGAFPNTTTTYTVIGGNSGCYNSATVTLYIIPSPIVSFSIQADATPHIWDLYPTFAGGSPPFSFSWQWGDGSPTSYSPYPTHTYSVAGLYNVSLSITDANGCYAYYTQNANLFKTSNNSEVLNMVQINVIDPITTSIQPIQNNNSISIFPNPTSVKYILICQFPKKNYWLKYLM